MLGMGPLALFKKHVTASPTGSEDTSVTASNVVPLSPTRRRSALPAASEFTVTLRFVLSPGLHAVSDETTVLQLVLEPVDVQQERTTVPMPSNDGELDTTETAGIEPAVTLMLSWVPTIIGVPTPHPSRQDP
jgi:hypothetical protein